VEKHDSPPVIPLWPNGAPGSEDWSWAEQEFLMPPHNNKFLRNVTQATLTAYLPDPARATGTAVVVCPGGAFMFLAIAHEGTEVAEWLVEHGVAAFVLKYRVAHTAEDPDEFEEFRKQRLTLRERMRDVLAQARKFGIADGQRAMAIVRERAAEWNVDRQRVGIIGFSAGGAVTSGVALNYDDASRPAFAAPIYGAPPEDVSVPADAPPLFMAFASDDDMAVRNGLPLYTKWRDSGHPVELHVFSQGGHGFGMRRQNLPSDHWIDLFGNWLGSMGLLQRQR